MQSIHDPPKSPSQLQVLRWIVKKILESKVVTGIIIFSTISLSFVTLWIPRLTGILIDEVLLSPSNFSSSSLQIQSLFAYSFQILFLGIVRSVLNLSANFSNETLAWRTERSIRAEFYRSIQEKPLAFHGTVRTGEIMALATNDTRQVNQMISPGLRMITDLVVKALGIIFLSLTTGINPLLLLATLPFIPLYILSVYHYNHKLAPISRTFQQKFAKISTAMQDNLEGIRIVRAFGSEDYEQQKFQAVIEDFKNTWYKRQRAIARYYPLLTILLCIGTSFIFGLQLVSINQLTIGGLIAFNGLLIVILIPTYLISFAITLAQGGLAAFERIQIVLEAEPDLQQKTPMVKLDTIKGQIEFRNMAFSYNSNEPLFHNFNLKINPGERLAIVGHTGSGKTSLASLIGRFYEYQEGEILIDDQDIRTLDLGSYRKHLGIIQQEVFLFAGTIRENICYGRQNATNTEIFTALENINAREFIDYLHNGLDTQVGERGTRLSLGQRQLISFARTLLADPKILILDEATSSVDAYTEAVIQEALTKLLENRTSIIIAHRLSTIKNADRIIVLDQGEIIEEGTHPSLMEKNGFYADLYETYFKHQSLDWKPNYNKKEE